jgi:ATP-binding cassette, subfamily A (ABC1), member 3
VLWDSGSRVRGFQKHVHISQGEEAELVDRDILEEVQRVMNSNDGLRVLHASKVFGRNVAVSDVSFGAPEGDVFALLAPTVRAKRHLFL